MDGEAVSGVNTQDSVDAEAAAWIARLHGTRAQGTDAALRTWLKTDPSHEEAFERATELWAILPGAAQYVVDQPGSKRSPHASARRTRRHVLAVAAMLLLLVSAGVIGLLSASPEYSTGVGEQQMARLEDGSRIALNTDSRVEVNFSPDQRRIRLDRGEAMFEVAHDPNRPFIVRAGNKQVRALGTVFTVRREGDSVTVTLIKGKVSVTSIAPPKGEIGSTPNAELTPGERLLAPSTGPWLIKNEPIDSATAWRRGKAIFRDTPLAEAAAELNRYGGPQLQVDDPRIASLPISGVFTTGSTNEFADAVARLHGLRVVKSGKTLKILR